MNLILLTENDFISNSLTAVLSGRRFEHICRVLKSSVGDLLKVGLLNGKIGNGKILKIEKSAVHIRVTLTRQPPAKLDVRLIIALPRPPMVKRILFNASAMGVKQIVFIHSRRVEKSFWKSSTLDKASIEEQLLLGLEQAVDTVMPQVILRQKFKPFVEDELSILAHNTNKYLAHPHEVKNKKQKDMSLPATIVIGPEGGFIDYEVDQFKRLGFEMISLGERILRVETAVTVLLGKC